MSKLQDFLALPDVSSITEEIYINERLGTFTVKPMTEKQWDDYRNRCKGKFKKDGMDFDNSKFNLLVITGQVIEPNFSDAEFLSRVGCVKASDFITRKFLAGEIADIVEKITKISGFDDEDGGINKEIEDAKN